MILAGKMYAMLTTAGVKAFHRGKILCRIETYMNGVKVEGRLWRAPKVVGNKRESYAQSRFSYECTCGYKHTYVCACI